MLRWLVLDHLPIPILEDYFSFFEGKGFDNEGSINNLENQM